MNKPFISYLVTTHDEGESLLNLLKVIDFHVCMPDSNQEIVILDDFSTEKRTQEILNNITNPLCPIKGISVYQHALNNNYGEHKNYGKSLCKGEYIFQIDGDEVPDEALLQNLPEILKSNSNIELFWVPRVNLFKGVTPEHAKQWGWHLSELDGNTVVNWNTGDYQSRIFKNKPEIKWEKRLHEIVVGAKTFAKLPKEEEYALYHNKTIEKQIETNLRYNKVFTQKENMGM